MRKLLSNRLFIIVVITLIVIAVIIFSAVPGNPIHRVVSPVTTVFHPFQKGLQRAGDQTSDFWASIVRGVEIRQENEALYEEVAQLKYELQKTQEAMVRWEELKDALHLQDAFENYEIYGALILSREADEWFNLIRVDVGRTAGIEITEDRLTYAVIDAQMNLVGRVMTTDYTSSKILPIFHEGFSCSAKVNKVNGALVRISGETLLKSKNLIRLDQIPAQADILVGDEVVTSGAGGIFPAGIPIGIVVEVSDPSSLHRYAVVKPYIDMTEIKDVFILSPIEEEIYDLEEEEIF